jgi:hypothetical protein
MSTPNSQMDESSRNSGLVWLSTDVWTSDSMPSMNSDTREDWAFSLACERVDFGPQEVPNKSVFCCAVWLRRGYEGEFA